MILGNLLSVIHSAGAAHRLAMAHLAGIIARIVTGWLRRATGSYAAPMQAIWVILLVRVGAGSKSACSRPLPR